MKLGSCGLVMKILCFKGKETWTSTEDTDPANSTGSSDITSTSFHIGELIVWIRLRIRRSSDCNF